MKKRTSILIIAAAISLALLLGCDDRNGDNNTILALPNVVTQGAPGPCATMDNQNYIIAFVTLAPGSAEPALQATSSNTANVTVSPTPRKAGRTPGGNGFEAQFGFSCNTRGTEADITITDPAGQLLAASVKVVCLKALTLGRFDAGNLALLEPGRSTRVDVKIDPRERGIDIRSFLSPESAGRFQVTPGVNKTNTIGLARFDATCSEPGANGRVDFSVRDPNANPNVQIISCPLQCRGEE